MLSDTWEATTRLYTRPWFWVLLLVMLFAGYHTRAQHVVERMHFWLTRSSVEDPATESLLRREYQVVIDARAVDGVVGNLSGLTYDEVRDHLWAVVNNPEELLAMSRDGQVMARYALSGFSDVEGITYLGDDLLLVAEERKHSLVAIPVPGIETDFLRDDYSALTLDIESDTNGGFEGVGYDRARDRLFVAKEHSPMRLYEIRGFKASLQGDFSLQIFDRANWIKKSVFAKDLSSVHFNAQTGTLALLSDASKRILELDGDNGKLISLRNLKQGFAGMLNSTPQAEGLTFDDQGSMYIVSEPNLFYRFDPT